MLLQMMFENFGTVVYCFQISFKTNLDELFNVIGNDVKHHKLCFFIISLNLSKMMFGLFD